MTLRVHHEPLHSPEPPFVGVDSKYWRINRCARLCHRDHKHQAVAIKSHDDDDDGEPDVRQTAKRCRVGMRGFSSCHTLMQPTLFKPIREAASWMVKAAVTHLQERCAVANAVYGRTADALLGLRGRETDNIDAAVGGGGEINCWENCRTA